LAVRCLFPFAVNHVSVYIEQPAKFVNYLLLGFETAFICSDFLHVLRALTAVNCNQLLKLLQ